MAQTQTTNYDRVYASVPVDRTAARVTAGGSASDELSAEEQAQLDAMRDADAQPDTAQSAADPGASPPPAADPQQQQRQAVPVQEHENVKTALRQERERIKQYEREREEDRRQRQQLEERTNLLLQRFNQPPQEARPAEQKPAIPELATDPVGHIVGTQEDLRRQLQASQQGYQQQQQQMQQFLQQQAVVAEVTRRAQASEQAFALEHPDYASAVQHLTKIRHQELEKIGFRDPAERYNVIQREGLEVAARMMQIGGNPAEAIYELAKIRGFAPAQQAAAAQPEPAQPSAAEQKLQNIAAGQQQARSLGAARGTGPGQLTAQRLLEMPQDEFAKMLESAEGMALLGS